MAAPVVTMHQLIEAGAHFGHQTHRWNPRMKPYIFGARNGIHILDLSQSVPLMARALEFIAATVQNGGKVLFVGTKRQAQDVVAEAAKRSAMYFVNSRWLGTRLARERAGIDDDAARQAADLEFLREDVTELVKESMDGLKRVKDIVQALKDFSHV
eukprot:gene47382-58039_t